MGSTVTAPPARRGQPAAPAAERWRLARPRQAAEIAAATE